jgi:hypothetical protein
LRTRGLDPRSRSSCIPVNSLSGKFLLVTLLGYREGAGHQLIPRDAAEALEARWRQEVLSADPESLAGEWDLLRVLYWASQDDGSAILAETLLDPAVTVALLKSARSEASSQPIDSRAVRVAQRLAWDTLVSIEGDEATLLERIEDARVMLSREDPSLLELVDRYVSGWRPREFGDD